MCVREKKNCVEPLVLLSRLVPDESASSRTIKALSSLCHNDADKHAAFVSKWASHPTDKKSIMYPCTVVLGAVYVPQIVTQNV